MERAASKGGATRGSVEVPVVVVHVAHPPAVYCLWHPVRSEHTSEHTSVSAPCSRRSHHRRYPSKIRWRDLAECSGIVHCYRPNQHRGNDRVQAAKALCTDKGTVMFNKEIVWKSQSRPRTFDPWLSV